MENITRFNDSTEVELIDERGFNNQVKIKLVGTGDKIQLNLHKKVAAKIFLKLQAMYIKGDLNLLKEKE